MKSDGSLHLSLMLGDDGAGDGNWVWLFSLRDSRAPLRPSGELGGHQGGHGIWSSLQRTDEVHPPGDRWLRAEQGSQNPPDVRSLPPAAPTPRHQRGPVQAQGLHVVQTVVQTLPAQTEHSAVCWAEEPGCGARQPRSRCSWGVPPGLGVSVLCPPCVSEETGVSPDCPALCHALAVRLP